MTHLRPAAPAPTREMFAEGAGWTPEDETAPATHTVPDPTPTSGEAGSPTYPAAEVAAAEAALATSTRACLLCV
jgi:hypothetical protein